ncbi:MAG: AmmeMemoRadiSam system protein B [Planctomycetes bacterium]|nr:AmmeMemoRadiSam system protein B [Planctomycetota bacterium]
MVVQGKGGGYDASMNLPRLRPLDVVPVEHEGKTMFRARDNEGIIEQEVVLPPVVFVVWSMLDGSVGLADLQDRIAERFKGTKIPLQDLENIVRDLDEHFLLESDRLAERRREIADAYRNAPHRPPKFAGLSYSKSPVQLSIELDGYFKGEKGAGLPDGSAAGEEVRGVIAPHIDFPRGGWCYTHAYREIAQRSRADLYLILGVAHASPPNPMVVTSKSYHTPLGPAETDRDFVDALAKRFPRCFDDEVVHRNEHSAEFQAVFLRHARRDAPFTVVPILCSAFEMYCGPESPSSAPRVEEFLQALRETLEASGKKTCIVAGVDYAHVGPRFGDKVDLDQKLVDWMTAEDRKSLDRIREGDAEGFWQSVVADGNRRHVCGLSATYAALRLLGPAKGGLLQYGYAPDPAGGIVSFAAAAF